jgi:hypothetical protein
MYPNGDGHAFDFDKEVRSDGLRVTPQLHQKGKSGPEFDVAHHDAYPNGDGYAFDFDKELRSDGLRVTG